MLFWTCFFWQKIWNPSFLRKPTLSTNPPISEQFFHDPTQQEPPPPLNLGAEETMLDYHCFCWEFEGPVMFPPPGLVQPDNTSLTIKRFWIFGKKSAYTWCKGFSFCIIWIVSKWHHDYFVKFKILLFSMTVWIKQER